MRLMGLEFAKIWRSRMAMVALLVLLVIDVMLFVTGSNGYYAVINPDFEENLAEAKTHGDYFKGAITKEWTQTYEEEAEKIKQEHPEWIDTWAYEKYEDVMFSANFYSFAARRAKTIQETYQATYDGEKGQAMAEETGRWYSRLTDGTYIANYNYDLGWQMMRFMLSKYPFTVGMLLVIGLSSLFSGEYARKTDSLLLSSRYGKSRLIAGKVAAAMCFAAGSWALFTLLNGILCLSFYGPTGGEAFWQDWIYCSAPWKWDQLTAVLVSLATSLMGCLYLGGVIMVISAVMKTPVSSMLLSLALVLLPVVPLGFNEGPVIGQVLFYTPGSVIQGELIWQGFRLRWLFGLNVLDQILILLAAALFTVAAVLGARRAFGHHQVMN